MILHMNVEKKEACLAVKGYVCHHCMLIVESVKLKRYMRVYQEVKGLFGSSGICMRIAA